VSTGLRPCKTCPALATQPTDYYEQWHTERESLPVLDRELAHLELLRPVVRPGDAILDAGCGDGRFLVMLGEEFPEARIVGADYSPVQVEVTTAAGLDVVQANFEAELPFDDGEFAVVNLAQVIEHLYDPDRLLDEIHRVLRPGGRLVLSTPNLVAWFNRVLVPLGIQPIFYESSTRSSSVGTGMLRRFKATDRPVGHVRLFTLTALRDILELHGFTVTSVRGALFDERLPQAGIRLDRVFAHRPRLASILVLSALRSP
jgi:SAM-dependent methyltransferase